MGRGLFLIRCRRLLLIVRGWRMIPFGKCFMVIVRKVDFENRSEGGGIVVYLKIVCGCEGLGG